MAVKKQQRKNKTEGKWKANEETGSRLLMFKVCFSLKFCLWFQSLLWKTLVGRPATYLDDIKKRVRVNISGKILDQCQVDL